MKALLLFLWLSIPLTLLAQNSLLESRLLEAAKWGQYDEIKAVFEEAEKENITLNLEVKGGFYSTTPLYKVVNNAMKDNIEDSLSIMLLLNKGADIHFTDKFGGNLLHLAADNRLLWLAKRCVDAGIDVNSKSGVYFTPLYQALINRDEQMIHFLIDNGADVLTVEPVLEQSMLHLAAENELFWLIKLCIERGADINRLSGSGLTSLLYLCQKPVCNMKIFHWLIQHGANTEYAMTTAVKAGNTEVIRYFLKNSDKISPNTGTLYKNNHLIELNDTTSVDKVFSNKERKPLSMLQIAACYNHCEVISVLLEEKFSLIDEKNNEGNTALHLALLFNHTEAAACLLKHGANPSITNENGDTPLHYWAMMLLMQNKFRHHRGLVIKYREVSVIQVGQMLLNAKVDINAVNKQQKTPLDIAIGRTSYNDQDNNAIVKLLKSNGAKQCNDL